MSTQQPERSGWFLVALARRQHVINDEHLSESPAARAAKLLLHLFHSCPVLGYHIRVSQIQLKSCATPSLTQHEGQWQLPVGKLISGQVPQFLCLDILCCHEKPPLSSPQHRAALQQQTSPPQALGITLGSPPALGTHVSGCHKPLYPHRRKAGCDFQPTACAQDTALMRQQSSTRAGAW